MFQNHAKDLFQLQIELVDAKVDIAVGKSTDRIIDHIENLRTDVHSRIENLGTEFHKLNNRFTAVETRLSGVEDKLGMKSDLREKIRGRFIDYAFKAGWLVSAAVISVVASAIFLYIRHL